MRSHAFALAAVILAATPAHATQGQLCRPAAGTGPSLSVVIGTPGVAGVTLIENGRSSTTMAEGAPLAIRQSWFDADRLWIDLTDAADRDDEGRLRLQFAGRGRARHLAGTFVRRGRVYRLLCSES